VSRKTASERMGFCEVIWKTVEPVIHVQIAASYPTKGFFKRTLEPRERCESKHQADYANR